MRTCAMQHINYLSNVSLFVTKCNCTLILLIIKFTSYIYTNEMQLFFFLFDFYNSTGFGHGLRPSSGVLQTDDGHKPRPKHVEL